MFNDRFTPEISTLSLHDALPISPYDVDMAGASARPPPALRVPRLRPRAAEPRRHHPHRARRRRHGRGRDAAARSEEHTSELQSHSDLVCRLLLEKNNTAVETLPR